VLVSIRPEDVEIGPAESTSADNRLEGVVVTAVYMGGYVDYQVAVEGVRIRAYSKPSTPYCDGDRVSLGLPPAACVCIPEEANG
jgi:ABC-type Fe3+/spermidine/putrescine transport system ATPase subunit